MTQKPRQKYTPCWVVVRLNHPAHVLAVFEYLDQAEVYAEKCQQEYEARGLTELSVQIQPADYSHF